MKHNVIGISYHGKLNYRNHMLLVGLGVLSIILLLSIGAITKTVTAERYNQRAKLVTSVEIQKGDTLWSIAANYITDEYKSMKQYIEEIKFSNGLTSDNIQAGNYIIVPYYADSSR